MADSTGMASEAIPRSAISADRATARFRFYQRTRSDVAARPGIDNSCPGACAGCAAVLRCRNAMKPVRTQFGSFTPNGVDRGPDLERALQNKRADRVRQHTPPAYRDESIG